MSVRTLAAILLPAMACLSGPSCERDEGPAANERLPNLLLVSIDTLRSDHVHCYGYPRETTPRLDALARDGAVFEQHVSNTSWTLPSHVTLLTGLPETIHGVDADDAALDPARTTLAEVLEQRGYRTAGFFSGPYLHPTFGFAQGFEVYESCMTIREPPIPLHAWNDLNDTDRLRIMDRHSYQVSTGPEVVARATAWLESLGDDEPWFLFLHFFDCHWDYMPPDACWQKFDPDYDGTIDPRRFISNPDVHAGMPKRDLEHLIARYDGEILFTDEMVGRVLDFVAASGALDETLVVVTSDHGEEFFEHGSKGHRVNLFDESLRVPWILRHPARVPAGARVAAQTAIVDVMPTVLDVLGVDAPAEVTGRSLVPLWRGSPPEELLQSSAFGRLVPAGAADPLLRFVRDERSKLVTARAPGTELDSLFYFDLEKDPGEQDVTRGNSREDGFPLAVMRALFSAVEENEARDRAIAAGLPQLDPGAVPVIDEDLRRQLFENGYLSGE